MLDGREGTEYYRYVIYLPLEDNMAKSANSAF